MGRGGTGVLGWWGYERGLCVAILPVLSGNIFARLLRLKEERRRRKEEKKAAAAQKRSERRAAEQVGIAEGGRTGAGMGCMSLLRGVGWRLVDGMGCGARRDVRSAEPSSLLASPHLP